MASNFRGYSFSEIYRHSGIFNGSSMWAYGPEVIKSEWGSPTLHDEVWWITQITAIIHLYLLQIKRHWYHKQWYMQHAAYVKGLTWIIIIKPDAGMINLHISNKDADQVINMRLAVQMAGRGSAGLPMTLLQKSLLMRSNTNTAILFSMPGKVYKVREGQYAKNTGISCCIRSCQYKQSRESPDIWQLTDRRQLIEQNERRRNDRWQHIHLSVPVSVPRLWWI